MEFFEFMRILSVTSDFCLENTDWCDEVFLEKHAPKKRFKPVTMDVRKTAALNLINFFSGKCPPHDVLRDIKIMIYTLLSPTEPGTDFFHFIFDDNSKSSLAMPSTSPKPASDFDKECEDASNEVNAFWKTAASEIKKLTQAELKNKTDHPGLMYLSAIGFICLTLFQIKERGSWGLNKYMNNHMAQNFQNLYKPPKDMLKIPPICGCCMQELNIDFTDEHVLEAFGLILTGYIYFKSNPNANPEKVAVLMEGCLRELMYHHMHVVGYFEQVKEKTNLDAKQLKDVLLTAKSNDKNIISSLKRIIELYETQSVGYEIKGHKYLPQIVLKPQLTWKWARVFCDDNYLTLSGSKDYNLGLIARLGAILSMYPEHAGIDRMIVFSPLHARKMLQSEMKFAKMFFKEHGSKN